MDKLKAHKLLLGCSLVLMVVFGIILICDYVSKSSPEPWGVGRYGCHGTCSSIPVNGN